MVNGSLRRNIPYHVLGRKSQSHLYVASKDNVADDPSRRVPLRKPQPAPSWLAKLVVPQPMCLNPIKPRRPSERMVQELFAGCGRLSLCLLALGLWVARPLEAHPCKGVYIKASDLLDDLVFEGLRRSILSGLIWYIHLGTPCGSWAPLARTSGGTRRRDKPEGDGSLSREVTGNCQADRSGQLCALILSV